MSLKSYISAEVLTYCPVNKWTEWLLMLALKFVHKHEAECFVTTRLIGKDKKLAIKKFSDKNLIKLAMNTKHELVAKMSLLNIKDFETNKNKITETLVKRTSLELFASVMDKYREKYTASSQQLYFEQIGRKSNRFGTPALRLAVLEDGLILSSVEYIRRSFPNFWQEEIDMLVNSTAKKTDTRSNIDNSIRKYENGQTMGGYPQSFPS